MRAESEHPPASPTAWTWILDVGLALVAVQVAGMVGSVVGALAGGPDWLVLAAAWTVAGAVWALVRNREQALGWVRCLVGGVVGVGLSAVVDLWGLPSWWILADLVAGGVLFAWSAHGVSALVNRRGPPEV